jgi:hypothetical protein
MSERKLPVLCPGGTVVCIAPGPSLTVDDVEYVRGKATVLAVSKAIEIVPWADAVLSVDQLWWSRNYQKMRAFSGLKLRTHATNQKVKRGHVGPKYCQGCQRRMVAGQTCWCAGVITLYNDGVRGVCFEPDAIRTTDNSGGAAINVAVHLGAARILLLGYDMGMDERGRRYFSDTGAVTITSPFSGFRKHIATMVAPLKAAGITVLNCSRQSKLECFPRVPLREALVAQAA